MADLVPEYSRLPREFVGILAAFSATPPTCKFRKLPCAARHRDFRIACCDTEASRGVATGTTLLVPCLKRGLWTRLQQGLSPPWLDSASRSTRARSSTIKRWLFIEFMNFRRRTGSCNARGQDARGQRRWLKLSTIRFIPAVTASTALRGPRQQRVALLGHKCCVEVSPPICQRQTP